ncbi:hypothetical protein GCM10010249_60040 [Streptomyces roseolilacinus]|uniref:Uncharacterized protein n=1 Tax=Streptomyces roseolilacinus TaxID=66904 RepID=A0A918B657_9ACTN|nr:hypothetical protein GCM10010249_60040 [Streptomyces roseolilacinus]
MLDGHLSVLPQCLPGTDDLAVGHQHRVHAILAGGVQGHGGGAAGARGVGGDGVDGDVDQAVGGERGVQRAAVLRLHRHGADVVVLGGGGHPGEQAAAVDRDHHGVQAGDPLVDLFQQGVDPGGDQGVVVGVRGERAGRGGKLFAGGQASTYCTPAKHTSAP